MWSWWRIFPNFGSAATKNSLTDMVFSMSVTLLCMFLFKFQNVVLRGTISVKENGLSLRN